MITPLRFTCRVCKKKKAGLFARIFKLPCISCTKETLRLAEKRRRKTIKEGNAKIRELNKELRQLNKANKQITKQTKKMESN